MFSTFFNLYHSISAIFCDFDKKISYDCKLRKDFWLSYSGHFFLSSILFGDFHLHIIQRWPLFIRIQHVIYIPYYLLCSFLFLRNKVIKYHFGWWFMTYSLKVKMIFNHAIRAKLELLLFFQNFETRSEFR